MGALTSKSYAFTGRPWENSSFESLDILNGFCSSIIIESRGVSIMRVLPKAAWLPDRIRVVYDSLNYGKVVVPYLKQGRGFREVQWGQASNFLTVIFTVIALKNYSLLRSSYSCQSEILCWKEDIRYFFRKYGFAYFK